jgi:hypothetical protein
MKRALIALLVLAAAASAQNTVRKVIPLKYVSPEAVANLLSVFGERVIPHATFRMIAISGSPEVLKAMEEMIAKVDVPPSVPKNIELTAYLLVGSEDGPAGPVPAAIQPAVKQLQSLFTYKSFHLLDTLFLRLREGESGSSSNGAIQVAGETTPGTSSLTLGRIDLAPGAEGSLVRINNLRLSVTVPSGRLGNGDSRMVQTAMRTDIDVREGQKVVVGKAKMTGLPDQALILVLTAKVVD